MSQSADAVSPPPAETPADASGELRSQFESGANWFFWIAALSLVNSAIALMQGQWAFIVGLGVTQVFDGLALAVAAEAPEVATAAKVFALAADLVAAGVFVLFGVLARKQLHWAFVTGMVLYTLDGLIFLLFGDWLSVGFHAFALWCLYRGLACSRRLKAQAAVSERFEARAA